MPILLYPEGKMPLGKIADDDHQPDSDHLAEHGIPVQYLYQQLEHAIVDDEIKSERKKIPEQLYAAPQIGAGKNHVAVKNKADDKSNGG